MGNNKPIPPSSPKKNTTQTAPQQHPLQTGPPGYETQLSVSFFGIVGRAALPGCFPQNVGEVDLKPTQNQLPPLKLAAKFATWNHGLKVYPASFLG